MSEIPLCPECKVPGQFVDNHLWLSGGTVVQSTDQEHRMVLLECENLDPLFRGIEEIIGVPIERIVIETKRRATRDYLNRLIPDEVKNLVRSQEISVVPLIEAVNVTGHVLGYGDSKLVDVKFENEEDDYVIEHIAEPYSVPLWCGDLAGSSEAVSGSDHDVGYKLISPDLWELKAWPSPRPVELQERLKLRQYGYVDGGIEPDRCATCGGPWAFTAYRWDTDRGVIEMAEGARRVAMLGSSYLEVIFDELERELGEEIPSVVVEAQRRFTKKGVYSAEEIGSEDQFRSLLALRGLGNLLEMKMGNDGLKMRLQNATLHLMIAGLIQGYFETATGAESHVDWEMKEDGTLELEIAART